MTSENLGYKPGVVEQAKFEYSPLGKVFNEGLEKEDKKQGPLKTLKIIEAKKEEQLNAIKDQGEIQLDMTDNQIKEIKKEIKRIEF